MQSSGSIDELIENLKPDQWRRENSFSEDIEKCNQALFNGQLTRSQMAEVVSDWFSLYQPCLFGRHAAKDGKLSFCILTETDLAKGDEHIRDVIQDSREDWKRRALNGSKHGFIILAVSKELAYAEPNESLLKIALRLGQLYLSKQLEPNGIEHDQVNLEINRTAQEERRKWKVGVNIFAAQADKRWWHDHRVPGGIAFSMNSVGHFACQKALDEILRNPAYAERVAKLQTEKLVKWALPLAMRTILKASKGSIPGTRLAKRESDSCPISVSDEKRQEILRDLASYSENIYHGWYHTDQTVPAEYFQPTPIRTPNITESTLLFTYLHSLDDEDYEAMGIGEIELES